MDRITKIRITGFRVLRDVTLELDGLTVLIGDNGTGKSTLLDAFELLRLFAKPQVMVMDMLSAHGGLPELLARGARHLGMELTIEGDGPRIVYGVTLGLTGGSASIHKEKLDLYGHGDDKEPLHVVARSGSRTQVYDVEAGRPLDKSPEIDDRYFAVSSFGSLAQPALQRVVRALEGIDHQVAFETRPLWQQHELDARRGPRWPNAVDRASGLQRHGTNLADVYQTLKNGDPEHWQKVIERVRLGLGDELRDLRLEVPTRGQIDLQAVFSWAIDEPISARVLSEGQLAYLLFVALVEFPRKRSVLLFDEPEVHLHPALLARVAWLLEDAAKGAPTLVATHSDRFLDALAEPAASVVLCELDHVGSTRLRRPDAARLAKWLEDYRGLGAIRAEGYGPQVFTDPEGDQGAGG